MARMTQAQTRERILDAAGELMDAEGLDAVSTRAIATAAGVQAPAIYRIFGDKQGLLDALAVHQFSQHLVDKAALPTSTDPVDDLRSGWDQHVRFGLDHPDLYAMVYGGRQSETLSDAAAAAYDMLRAYVHRAAEAGRLILDEQHASQLMHAAGRGVTLTLLGTPAAARDMSVSDLAREAVLARITTPAPDRPLAGGTPGPSASTGHEEPLATPAIALRARLDEAAMLTDAERALLAEWLQRIARGQA